MMHESCKALFAFTQRVLGSSPFNEQTDLIAQRGHHLEKIGIRFSDSGAEELNNTQGSDAVQNRKSECATQSHFPSNHLAGKVAIRAHIEDPGRSSALPNSAGEAI